MASSGTGSNSKLKEQLGITGEVDMTEADLHECMEVFKELQSGERIAVSKLAEAFDRLNVYINEVYVEDMIKDLTAKGIVELEFFDFATLICSKRTRKRRSTNAILSAIFGLIDRDNDGFIGASELKDVMQTLGEMGSDETVNQMISQLDSSGKGRVSYEQFLRMLHDAAL